MPSTLQEAAGGGPHDIAEATGRFRFDLEDVLIRDAETRADMMVRAAVALCVTSGPQYLHEGRGPGGFDDIGFVRAVVQAAADWDAYRNLQPMPAEIDDHLGYAADQARFNPDRYSPVLSGWGLVQGATAAGANVYKAAQPGDVILYMGRGPAMGVVIAPFHREPYEGPAVAYARAPEGPKVSRQSLMNFSAVALYRWPEAVR